MRARAAGVRADASLAEGESRLEDEIAAGSAPRCAAPALAHLPVALFSSVMGLVGLGLAWRQAASVFGTPGFIGEAVIVLSAGVYVVLLIAYALKAIQHFAAVRSEFADPVAVNFFPAFSIGTMLLASGALPHAPRLAHVLWALGASLTFALTIVMIGRWLTHRSHVHHVNPAWFMPVVGNIVAPLAAVPLGHRELGWFFFSVGMIFWIPLFTIVLYRLVFHDRMPPRLLPTLLILIGPPAVAFSAYVMLTGSMDGFARVLLYGAVFIALVIASVVRLFVGIPFAPSWWAFTFPLDALAIAVMHYGGETGGPALRLVAAGLLTLVTGIVTFVGLRTALALVRGSLFQPR